jgi:3-hydroxyisobutyrate dehydrogenase-like beta-hydroxyacid dehydrogenase
VRIFLFGIGEMGGSIGHLLQDLGHEILVEVSLRSEASIRRVRKFDFTVVDSFGDAYPICDAIVSVVPTNCVMDVTEKVCSDLAVNSIHRSERKLFLDLNAGTPKTAEIQQISVSAKGYEFVNGAIIGPPYGDNGIPSILLSGSGSRRAAQLFAGYDNSIDLGQRLAKASEIKLLYSALHKGSKIFYLSLLATAYRLGVSTELSAEVQKRIPYTLDFLESNLGKLIKNAGRWSSEMIEIEKFMADIHEDHSFFRSAHDLYREIGDHASIIDPDNDDSLSRLQEILSKSR